MLKRTTEMGLGQLKRALSVEACALISSR